MKLVFVRHGESEWNLANRFTGWVDVDLSNEGYRQAQEAGQKIKAQHLEFDIAFTSVLKRAIKTCNIVLEEIDQLWVPQVKSWRLNERHYGALQGLNKKETAEKYGEDQVHTWRRSYDTLPPLLDADSPMNPSSDRRYRQLEKSRIPIGENLKITLERAIPFWEDQIAPAILDHKTCLVAAHGNSLRALAKHIEEITDEDIMQLEIPTGKPLVYELDEELNILDRYYL